MEGEHLKHMCLIVVSTWSESILVGSVLSFSVTGDRFSSNDQVLRNKHPAMFSCNDQVLRDKHPAVLQQQTALPHFWAMTLAA